MKPGLSPKKQRFLDFVRNFAREHDRAPTFHEIMQGLRLRSLGTVNWYVRELERMGLLQRRGGYNAKRALMVTDRQEQNTLPLLGIIAAGYPLESVEDQEEIEVPPSYVDANHYVLRVRGYSMVDDNSQEGDYVIIHQQPDARPGQTVVAFVNGEATLKRYYPRETGAELHPRNPEYEIIYVGPDDEFRIGGVVLSVIRKY